MRKGFPLQVPGQACTLTTDFEGGKHPRKYEENILIFFHTESEKLKTYN